ncbi:MAG TPA: hypothetical protein VGG31_00280 [Candidatus Dormibacteraeota bacterium]
MAGRARPTLRCLREDLGQAVPAADTPLDEVPHPLLAKASERFADDGAPRVRIASVDDQVLFKVKVQRWRGAVWVADDGIPWLVAAGQREEGSPDDFYAALAARGTAARSQYNAAHTPSLTTSTYTSGLLPGQEDELRWRAEHAVRIERRLQVTVHTLLRESLLDGHEHAAMLDGAALGIQILAEEGYSTYVAVRIIGSVPRRFVATILSLVPGCQLDAWMSDYAMPERAVAPEEQVWSNMMDPIAAAKLLDENP